MKGVWIVTLVFGLVLMASCGGETVGIGVGDIGNEDVADEDVADTDEAMIEEVLDAVDARDSAGQEIPCVANCANKACGDDGCGGSCGTCDDGNPCTMDQCEASQCVNTWKNLEELAVEECLCEKDEDCAPLEDGDFCNGLLMCDPQAAPSTCKLDESTVVQCSIPEGLAVECNVSVCIPETGVCAVALANEEALCDDGDPCTSGEFCISGACAGGQVVPCDDGNLCTDDSCDPLTGCIHADTSLSCDDGNLCTDDGCDPLSGCTYVDNTQPCDDGDPCTADHACSGGNCVGGQTLSCDDGDLCSMGSCDPDAGGCVYVCAAENPGNPCCGEGLCDDVPVCTGNPVIDEITPPGQALEETIVISGSGFGDVQEAGFVRLCGLKVSEVLSWNDETIVLDLPPGTHSGPVTVVDPWGFVSSPFPYRVNYNKYNEDPFRVWEPEAFSVKDVGYYTVGVRIEMEPGWVYLYTPTMLTTWDVSGLPTPVSAVALPSQATELELVGDHLFVTGSFGLEIYHTVDLQTGGFSSMEPPVQAAYAGVLSSSTAHAVVDGQVTAKGYPLHGTLVALLEWTMPESPSNRVLFLLWDPQSETLELLGVLRDSENLDGKILYDGVLWPHPTNPKLVIGECTVITGGTCTLREYDISNLDNLMETPAEAYLSGVLALPVGLEVPRDMKPYGDRIWIGPYGANLDASSHAAFHVFDLSPDGPPVLATSIDACSALLTSGTVPDEMQPCVQDADCPEGTGVCTNGWCVDRWTCQTDDDCPRNQGVAPPMDQVCVSGWCQTLCEVDADCTKKNTSNLCNDLFVNAPDPCVCIDGTCRICRSDHMGALDVIPELGLAVGIAGISSDEPEKHNIFLFDADAGPGEHLPLSSAETANFGMDVAAVPGRIAVADEWTAAQLFDFHTIPTVAIDSFAEPAWTDPQNRIFSPGWAMHVRQHPVIHAGRVYWGQGGIVGAAVDNLGDVSQWVSTNQQHGAPYTRTAGAGNGEALLFKGFIENFVTGMRPSHYQLYHADPATGDLTLLNDPLADSCPGMGEVLWWDDHVALSAEFNNGLTALYVDPNITDGTQCVAATDCGAMGNNCSSSVCVEGTCRCGVVERRALVAPLDEVANFPFFWVKTMGAWIDLERVDEDTVAAGWGWTYDPLGKAVSPAVPPEWGGLFFFDVGYPGGTAPSPSAPELEITLTPSEPPALNCTRGRRLWTIDSMTIEGDTWLLGVLDTDVKDLAPHVFSIFVVRAKDISGLNGQCLVAGEEGYSAQACQDQLEKMSIFHPTTNQFSPSFTGSGMDTYLAAEFWVYNGVPHVAVANRLGSGLPNAQQHVGVWVFNVDDPDQPGFDLGRIHETNVYFQPLTFSPSAIAPGHYTGHADVNTHLIPEAADLQRLEDGDLLVFGTGCTIARMGTP